MGLFAKPAEVLYRRFMQEPAAGDLTAGCRVQPHTSLQWHAQRIEIDLVTDNYYTVSTLLEIFDCFPSIYIDSNFRNRGPAGFARPSDAVSDSASRARWYSCDGCSRGVLQISSEMRQPK